MTPYTDIFAENAEHFAANRAIDDAILALITMMGDRSSASPRAFRVFLSLFWLGMIEY
jgi:hypothetical protein